MEEATPRTPPLELPTHAERLSRIRTTRRSPVPESEERALAERAAQGDRRALGKLFQAMEKPLLALLDAHFDDEQASQDAFQETCLRATRHVGRFVWRDGGFYMWLRTIATRVAWNRVGHSKDIPTDIGIVIDLADRLDHLDAPQCELDEKQALRVAVRETLAAIKPDYARILRDRYFHDRERAELASELGMTLRAFDTKYQRAMAAFRAAFVQRQESL